MIRILLILICSFLIFFINQSYSQTACGEVEDEPINVCNQGIGPGGLTVYQGLCGGNDVSFTMSSPPISPIPMCDGGGVLNNPSYFAFIADGTDIFNVTVIPIPGSCSDAGGFVGIQGALVTVGGCNTNNPIGTCMTSCTTGPFTLQTNGIPAAGTVMIIVLDGCNGSVCDVNFTINTGWTNNPEPPDDAILEQSQLFSDGTLGCGEVTFTVEPPFEGVCDYIWRLPDGTSVTSVGNSITINVNDLPSGNVCVQGFNEDCFPGQFFPASNSVCFPFVREDIEVDMASEPTYCGRDDGYAFVDNVTGESPWNYLWNTGTTTSFDDDLPAGIYTVTVTDGKGCEGIGTIEVLPSDPLIAEAIIIDSGCDAGSGSISITATGGSGFYNFTWSPNVATFESADNLAPGTYSVTVTDGADQLCDDELVLEVEIVGELEVTIISTTPADCGENNGSITFSANGPGNFTYVLVGPGGPYLIPNFLPNNVTIPGLPSGNFVLTVQDGTTACFKEGINVSVGGTAGPEIEAGVNQELCGVLNTTLNGTLSDGTGMWIQVSGPGTTIFTNASNPNTNITVSLYGTYVYRLSGTLNGCDGTPDEVTVVFNENPSIEIEDICDGEDLIIVATISGGTSPYTLGAGSTITGTFAGNIFTSNPVNGGTNYSLRVIDSRGCQSGLANFSHRGLPDLSVAEDEIILGCGDSNEGNITVSVNGSNSPDLDDFDFTWSLGTSTTNIVMYDGPGNYEVEVMEVETGCVSTIGVEVIADQDLPEVDAGVDVDLLCNSGTLTLNSTTNITGGIYEWSGVGIVGPTNGSSVEVNEPGVYEVTITNPENGCENSDIVEVIDERILPDVDAGDDLVIDCGDNGELEVTGSSTTGGVTYSWSTGNGTIIGNNNSAQITVGEAGTYILTVTNPANGCEESDSMIVTSDVDEPDVNVPGTLIINCYNEDEGVEIEASSSIGGVEYLWTPSGGGSIGGSNDVPEITGLTPGTYSVEVTNPVNGCSSVAEVVVTGDFEEPDVEAGPDETIDCTNLSAVLSGSTSVQNVSYAWTTNGGAINPPTNAQSVTVVSDGLYILTVTNLDNGCSASDELTVVSLDVLPDVAVDANNIPFYCTSDIITIIASSNAGGVEYDWTVQSGGGIVGGTDGPELQVDGPGQYRVTVLDPSNNCTRSLDVNVIDERVDPDADAGEDLILDCSDAGIKEITGSSSTPNVSYEWTNESMEVVGTTATITVTAPGIYTLTVTDNVNGCTSTSQMELGANEDIPQLSIPDELIINCYTQDSGIELEASSTTAGVEFEWSTGAMGSTTTVMSPGTYGVTVTNPTNGCFEMGEVEVIGDFVEPDVDAGMDAVVDCVDTQATLTGSTSVMNGQYLWSAEGGGNLAPPLNMATVLATRAGTYRLTITNPANGCSASDVVLVTSSDEIPVVSVAPLIILGCGEFSSEFVEGSSSIGGVEFTWTVISGGPTFGSDPNNSGVLITSPGVYELGARDPSTGCEGFAQVEVIMTDDLPIAEAGEDQELTCTIESITLSGVGSTGNNLTYLWESVDMGTTIPNPTQRDITVGNAGEFRLTVTNSSNGCSDSDIVRIFAEDDVLSDFIVEERDISCRDENNGSLVITQIIGGVAPYAISLNGVDVGSQQTFSSLSEGEYEIEIVDANGCDVMKTYTITNPEVLGVDLGIDLTINKGDILNLEAIVIGRDTGSVNIVWDTLGVEFGLDMSMVQISPSRSMDVRVTVIDDNGCIARSTIFVRVIRDIHIFVPNIFSPNGDGDNDILSIEAGREVISINSFMIYDRWGNFLFELKDFEPGVMRLGWDGTYKGKPVQTGVYVYVVNATLDDGTVKQVAGDVTVVY